MPTILSKYCYLFLEHNKYYIFNTENCFFTEININLYNLIKDRDFEEIDAETLYFLKNKKILIDSENVDLFYQESKFKYELSSYNKNILNLTLVPTLSCNFSCDYCFEIDKRNKTMNKETIEELLVFIEEHKDAKKINITWYGGEPLLAFNIIKTINNEIKSRIKIPLISQSVITNGYLLTPKVVTYFKEQKINSIQITLDGKEDTHNKTRKLHSGKGSFQTIIKNLDYAIEKLSDCQFLIRVNINNKNLNEYIELYKKLNERWKNNKNINIYPGFIREDTKDGKSLCSNCILPDSVIDLYKYFNNNGLKIKLYPKTVKKGCVINSINSYIIGPEGEIYKCWNDVSNEEKIIGFINKKEITNKVLFYRYMNEVSPFLNEECKKCKLLPICTGGCGWYRYKNLYENGSFDICSIYKNTDKLKDALFESIKSTQ